MVIIYNDWLWRAVCSNCLLVSLIVGYCLVIGFFDSSAGSLDGVIGAVGGYTWW